MLSLNVRVFLNANAYFEMFWSFLHKNFSFRSNIKTNLKPIKMTLDQTKL